MKFCVVALIGDLLTVDYNSSRSTPPKAIREMDITAIGTLLSSSSPQLLKGVMTSPRLTLIDSRFHPHTLPSKASSSTLPLNPITMASRVPPVFHRLPCRPVLDKCQFLP